MRATTKRKSSRATRASRFQWPKQDPAYVQPPRRDSPLGCAGFEQSWRASTALALGVAFPHFEVLSRKHNHNPFEPTAEIWSEVLDVARQQVGGTRFNRR